MPHHVTQRGNRRQETFFSKEDYLAYIELMAEWSAECKVQIWSGVGRRSAEVLGRPD